MEGGFGLGWAGGGGGEGRVVAGRPLKWGPLVRGSIYSGVLLILTPSLGLRRLRFRALGLGRLEGSMYPKIA